MGVDLISWRCRIGYFLCKILLCRTKYTISSLRLLKTKFIEVNFRKYLLLCSILLIVCGDVQKNPGPPTTLFPLQGNVHQGQDMFSYDSRGKQCVPCCLSIFLQTLLNPLKSKVWNANDVDNILIVGDYIYKCLVDAIGSQHDFLLVRDLPKYLTLQNKAYSWKVRKTYFSNISENYVGRRISFVTIRVCSVNVIITG